MPDADQIICTVELQREGNNKIQENIKEDEKKFPLLSYAIGKDKNEEQVKKSGKNYVILRLASVYGYSTDTMRLNIMPNLFSMIASQNGHSEFVNLLLEGGADANMQY